MVELSRLQVEAQAIEGSDDANKSWGLVFKA
jgi:hypothetical protein